jgi:hypothetical protein
MRPPTGEQTDAKRGELRRSRHFVRRVADLGPSFVGASPSHGRELLRSASMTVVGSS